MCVLVEEFCHRNSLWQRDRTESKHCENSQL